MVLSRLAAAEKQIPKLRTPTLIEADDLAIGDSLMASARFEKDANGFPLREINWQSPGPHSGKRAEAVILQLPGFI